MVCTSSFRHSGEGNGRLGLKEGGQKQTLKLKPETKERDILSEHTKALRHPCLMKGGGALDSEAEQHPGEADKGHLSLGQKVR